MAVVSQSRSGTAIQESGLRYLVQLNGPAVSFYQIEPATASDIVHRYLDARPDTEATMERAVYTISKADIDWDSIDVATLRARLITDLSLATAVARLRYRMVPEPIPTGGPAGPDVEGLAKYYKQYYNTPKGRATVPQFILNYATHVQGK